MISRTQLSMKISWFCWLLYMLFVAFVKASLDFHSNNTTNYCQKFSNATFIPETAMRQRFPPLLISFQGSGNTWIRRLIEISTGYYSGTIYQYFGGDDELLKIFPGELACGLRTSIIKAHPEHIVMRSWDGKVVVEKTRGRNWCARGLINSFRSFVFVARDPYRALFAEYQRESTGNHQ